MQTPRQHMIMEIFPRAPVSDIQMDFRPTNLCERQTLFRMTEKGGGEFKGLHDGFGGFGGFEEHLALLLLALQNTVPRDDRDGFDGFGGCGSFGRDGYPP